MAVTIPEVPFAKLDGRNLSCKEIGGDFFDAVNDADGLAVVLADVSGKGVSAALLASTLQGMIYSQIAAGVPLTDMVTGVNRFFTQKQICEKYATLILARLSPIGESGICQLRAHSPSADVQRRGDSSGRGQPCRLA